MDDALSDVGDRGSRDVQIRRKADREVRRSFWLTSLTVPSRWPSLATTIQPGYKWVIRMVRLKVAHAVLRAAVSTDAQEPRSARLTFTIR